MPSARLSGCGARCNSFRFPNRHGTLLDRNLPAYYKTGLFVCFRLRTSYTVHRTQEKIHTSISGVLLLYVRLRLYSAAVRTSTSTSLRLRTWYHIQLCTMVVLPLLSVFINFTTTRRSSSPPALGSVSCDPYPIVHVCHHTVVLFWAEHFEALPPADNQLQGTLGVASMRHTAVSGRR